MKFLVTGALGQLGRVTCEHLETRGIEVLGTDVPDVTVDDEQRLAATFEAYRPTHMLHCGAITDVDGCETNSELALLVNGEGTANVAALCRSIGAAMVYVSTDVVFDGTATRPYRHDDAPCPVSVYGESKLVGERAVLEPARSSFYVTRTSWVFGPGGGVYHMANEGKCSWPQFAFEILGAAGIRVEVGTMSSAELDRPAKRLAYSVLSTSRFAAVRGRTLPDYRNALRRYLEEELA
jgi:dTDP-4-dehydrorhamnose reductase